jgi:plastocyanin
VALLALTLTALLVLPVACGGDDDGGNGTPAATTPRDGNGGNGEDSFDVSMGDNFFEYEGEENPTFTVAPGATVTFNLTNDGAAVHNMRVAGEDNEYDTDDDAVSDPDIVSAEDTATLTWTAPDEPGEIDYQCQFHPIDMLGTITVE